MVYINGNFEPCSTEEDIVNICREYINDEFAEVVQNKFKALELEVSSNINTKTAQEAIQSCINDLKIISDELGD